MVRRRTLIYEAAAVLSIILIPAPVALVGWIDWSVRAQPMGVSMGLKERDAARQQEKEEPPITRMATAGDVATGRVIRELSDNEGQPQLLDLDTSPCSERDVVRFRNPYKKEKVGTLECFGKEYDKFKVEQK